MSFITKLLEKNRYLSTPTPIRIIHSLFLLAFLVTVSCSKPAGNIGIGIQPEDSKLKLSYTDTISLYAYSLPMDSIRSDYLTWNGIGSLKDPVFGHTNVGFYTQFILSKTAQEFGDERVLDSLVLYLDYYGVFADTNTLITAHIYEMEEGINQEQVYYSNLHVPIYPTDYGNISFQPRHNDSIVDGEDTIPPMLRMNLSKTNPQLGEKLLAASSGEMEDSDIFREYFKGLYVIAEPVSNSGCITKFDLTSSLSRMILFYHNNDAQDLRFDYLITTGEARVSKYEHNYSTGDADFRQQVVGGDTTLGAKKFYVQGFGGVKSIIKAPHLTELRNLGSIAINEAKLVLNGYESEPFWGAPDRVALYALNNDGGDDFLIDFYEGDSYFGGDYRSSSNNYTFRITRYIQSLINNESYIHYGFSLYVSNGWLTPNRFILNGNESDSTAKIKLEILYTDLN